MSARQYTTGGAKPNPFDTWNVQRDARRYLEAHSADLCCRSILNHIPPLGRKSSWPCVVVMGDGASTDAATLTHLRNLYLYGVLRAASMAQAHVIDTGLGSCVSVVSPSSNRSDFSRELCQVGITPFGIEGDFVITPIDRHSGFAGWKDRPVEFAQAKFGIIRRLTGARCRAVSILFNAGHAAFEEVEEACRLGIPCVVLKVWTFSK